MSKALYRKYRSKKLSEVVGQKHITKVLELALEQGKIGHAYLFTGPRGVGKTSIARILAHEINNLPYSDEASHPDIIEIDAASNNGVDDIRQLREQIQVAPFQAKKRIYIIDEVHMLSKPAFNALLKTLEEPPEHAVFILATTDAHKLPATIISRSQQFVFHFISQKDIVEHLRFIADSEKIQISDEALAIVAERGGGSFRDSISLLDQISALGKTSEITAEKLEQTLGLTPKNQILAIISNYQTQNIGEILRLLDEIKNSGVDLRAFCDQFLNEIKLLLPENPNLAKLLLPLAEAKNSRFLELELLSMLVDSDISPRRIIQPEITPKSAPTTPQNTKNTTPTKAKKPAKTQSEKQAEDSPNETEAKPENDEQPAENSPAKPFKWSDFVKEVKAKNPLLGGLISQLNYSIDDNQIIFYADSSFSQTRFSKPETTITIKEALNDIGATGWKITVIAEQKPPEDAVAAKVFDIMGGGEEVKIDE